MRFKVLPEDFQVEEELREGAVSEKSGPFTVYRVRKRGVTTLEVQAQIARLLGVGQSNVVFPALKDRTAVVIQHAAVRGDGPSRLSGKGFHALRVGRCSRPLTPTDICRNRFTVVLRDLGMGDDAHVRSQLELLERCGLPNYFDEQRFGSSAPGEVPIGRLILQRDVEGALRAYLTQPFAGDTREVRRFKRFASCHWGDWEVLFEAAPQPSNYRSVLTYLRDHPTATLSPAERDMYFRRALNLITPRLLSLYLGAYQALLWNRIAARMLVAYAGRSPSASLMHIEVAGERLPVHRTPLEADCCDLSIPLPSHSASYNTPLLQTIVSQVLAEEGLTIADMKARVLKRAYLSKSSRPFLVFPKGVQLGPAEADDLFPGRQKVTLAFMLPRGSYATLLIKALDIGMSVVAGVASTLERGGD